jgi:hypothetical protein
MIRLCDRCLPHWAMVRHIVLIAASAALFFGILIACLSWLVYPHVTVTIFNETSAAIRDVRLDSFYGERTSERIEPGAFAVTEFQIIPGDTLSMSYRDTIGIRKEELLYRSDEYSSTPRGSLEVHMTNKGIKLVNGNCTAVEFPCLTIHTWPTGRMTVR